MGFDLYNGENRGMDLNKLTWKELRKEFSFVKEVFEQPDALEDLINYYSSGEGLENLKQAKEEWDENKFRQVIFTGMGSSLYAALPASIILNQKGNIVESSELLYYSLNPDFSNNMMQKEKILLIMVSQSGESGEIVKILGQLEKLPNNISVWGITNNYNSTLFKKAHRGFLLKAGRELSVTSKSYCNSVVFLYLLSRILTLKSQADVQDVIKALIADIQDLSEEIAHLLSDQISIAEKLVDFIGKDVKFIEIIARGTSMATALQASLNIKETNKIPAEASSGGQFRHGPIEIINKDFRAILLSSDKQTRELQENMAWDITHKWGGGKVLYITNELQKRLEGEARVFQCVHGIKDPFLATVMEMILIQLFMLKLAIECGIKPGVFRYSSKITKDG